MKKLNYEVNGVKYILFKQDIKDKSSVEKLIKEVNNYKGILLSFKVVPVFIFINVVRVEVLIPENEAIYFSRNEMMK